jgi:hypothetical protein
MLWGCSSTANWHHPAKEQQAFQADHAYCMKLATSVARQKTMSGQRPDPAALQQAYNLCLESRGWRQTGADAGAVPSEIRPPEVGTSSDRLAVWGADVRVPAGFSLGNRQSNTAPGLGQTTVVYTGAGSMGRYLQCVFQESGSEFEHRGFPVSEPFFEYSKGRAGHQGTVVDWAFFAGEYQQAWTGGVGAYVLWPEAQRRAVLVATWSLPEQKEQPPGGLRLTQGQKQAMDHKAGAWTAWLKEWR